MRTALVAVLTLALVAALPAAASAKFNRAVAAPLSVSTDTLTPPTGVTVTCNRTTGITIRWTATTDVHATGYTIIGSYAGQSLTQPVSGRTTTSYVYNNDVPYGATVTLVSTVQQWTSAATQPVTVRC